MGGVALLLFLIIGGYLLLFPPLPLPPEIARKLPGNFAEADEEFGRRVSAAFPLPLSVDELTARLSEQGFLVDDANSYAKFEKSGFPCTLVWRVHWEATDGSINKLASRFGGVCL